jgi:hypothetical protein
MSVSVGITEAGIVMAKQSAHALRERELRERVLAAIRRADWPVEVEHGYSLGSIRRDVTIINFREKLVSIEIKNSLTSAAFGEFLRRATSTLNPRWIDENDYHPDEYWGVSYEVASSMMPSNAQIRVFTIEEFEQFAAANPEGVVEAETGRAHASVASTMAGNHDQIQVVAVGFVALIEERLRALRSERPNADDARAHLEARIADYEKLKSEVAVLALAAAALKTGNIQAADAANLSQAFGAGLEKWFKKKHSMVFDVAVYTFALAICSLAGSGGWITATALAGLVGGKKLTDVMKRAKGKK